jgi:hypothetical protein
MRTIINKPLRVFPLLVCAGLSVGLSARAQSPGPQAQPESQADLSSRIEALTQSVEHMQTELEDSRSEIRQLRSLLEQVLRNPSGSAPVNPYDKAISTDTAQTTSEIGGPPARITQDDWQLMNARVEEHEQVKVESSSKYRLKISGIALLNVFDTSGQVDNLDVPSVAVPRPVYASSGSVSASFRQSILGFRGIGPKLAGASTSADFQLDFINGTGGPYGGVAAGVVGLRIARLQFDWNKVSISGGLETPFFSPNSPTSYLSLAVPAFASAGNLWNWTPAIRAERRFDFTSAEFKVEVGLLDSTAYAVSGAGVRVPTPGEFSRQPAYSVRISGNNRMEDRVISFGMSAIYAPLSFPSRSVMSASGLIADWKFPLVARLQLSGAFFSGKGLDGFGGLPLPLVQPQDYTHYLYVTAPTLAGLPVVGGWSQLKFTLNNRSEFNAAGGLGARNAGRLGAAAPFDPLLVSVPASNKVLFFNYIFRPRSDLLFSAEYRRFHTTQISGAPYIAGQVGLAAGFLF